MRVYIEEIHLSTRGNGHIIDLTEYCTQILRNSGIRSGLVNVFVVGSTASITTIEYESGLLEDLPEAMERVAPQNHTYKHNRAWGDGNGHSHLRSSIIGPGVTIPVIEGSLALGTWQQVVLADWDIRPRKRRIIVTVMGE